MVECICLPEVYICSKFITVCLSVCVYFRPQFERVITTSHLPRRGRAIIMCTIYIRVRIYVWLTSQSMGGGGDHYTDFKNLLEG